MPTPTRTDNPPPPIHAGTGRGKPRLVLSLKTKFTIPVVGLALGVGTLAATFTLDVAGRITRRIHGSQCQQIASLLAAKAATDYADGGESLTALGRQAIRSAELQFVLFMDPENRTLSIARAESWRPSGYDPQGPTPDAPVGTPRFVAAGTDSPAYLDITYPVNVTTDSDATRTARRPSRLLGYVRIGFSLERSLIQIAAARNLLASFAILVASLVIPLGFLLVRRMLNPLEQLSRTMSRFAEGDHTARILFKRADELGQLADAFNTMADKLAHEREEIGQLNAELEERVQQRTRQLRELAARDPLTGLYNRRHLKEVLTGRYAEAQRYSTELTCVMIDLDGFKSVNDRFGHQTGDDLLVLTAITVTTQLRSADIAARFGGDEFILLLPHTDVHNAQILAQRIMRAFADAVAEQFPLCPVTMSIGIGCMTDTNCGDPEELVRAADSALYEAKTRGKNAIATRHVSV